MHILTAAHKVKRATSNNTFFTLASTVCLIADIDECQVDSSAAPCNTFAEYCVNSIGSFICVCRKDFTCGKCNGKHVRTKKNYRSRQA